MKSKFLIIVSLCVFVSMYVYADITGVNSSVQDNSQSSTKVRTRRNRAIPVQSNQNQTVNASRRAAALQNNPGQESTSSGQSEIVRGVNPLTQKMNAPVIVAKKNVGQKYLEQIQQAKNLNAAQPQAIETSAQVAEKVQYFEGLKGQPAQIKPPVARRPGLVQAAAAQKSINQRGTNQEVSVNNVNSTQSEDNLNFNLDYGTIHEPSTTVEYANNDLQSPVGMGDLYSAPVNEYSVGVLSASQVKNKPTIESAPSMENIFSKGDLHDQQNPMMNQTGSDSYFENIHPEYNFEGNSPMFVSQAQASPKVIEGSSGSIVIPSDMPSQASQAMQRQLLPNQGRGSLKFETIVKGAPTIASQKSIEVSQPRVLSQSQSINTGVLGGRMNKYSPEQIAAARRGMQSMTLSSGVSSSQSPVSDSDSNFNWVSNIKLPATSAQSKKPITIINPLDSQVVKSNSGLSAQQNAAISKQQTESALNIVARNNANFQRNVENASKQVVQEARPNGF